ncbi:uncharacterized protein DNG_10192 [Cephalotrichum gorgonifer]|uniref:Uncharacterized protein n=1 Tax=Cephalotrichum gorgonifer TaxID=2041049 RepID=A0AAE8T039_9PEZI|nr:uncharacterized protein DNG_10192 [Cephalotrichum gorgonifer]
MNRFRTRRKAKEEAAAAAKAAPPTPEPSNPFRLFKGKKSHEEPVEEKIDIANALPATDDFRTSLLMTGLSARFSMLREQDDPNTKIGKASDDSVLFPKRQSRIQDIAFRGLGDIAEVESIRAPPSLTRINSYNSASDADSGSMSVMDRARPTEGNVLFGGRQKIYKVSPAGSTSGGGLGKPLYEDDVSMSSFQRWKLAEKEKQAHEDQDSTDIATPLSRASDLEALRPESPSTYNKKRETGSTTSSAPSASRNSTAATSITSQKDFHHPGSSATSPTPIMEKTVARTRRLYEQGLTQDLQNQQSHALSRIDTLARKTPGRLPDISQNISSTAHLFGDRVVDRRLLSKGSAPNMQPSSPLTAPRSSTSTAASPVDAGFRATGSHETKPFGASPPLSPPISEHEEHPTLPIQASDKGKATAMGVFHKPAQPYDESRFAQRQIQMQQGRETPTGMSRTDSDASRGAQRSPSPVAPQAAVSRPRVAPADATTPEVLQRSTMTFFDDDAEDSLPPMPHSRIPTRQAGPVRPADEDHPAFRSSALPTPLSVTSPMFDEEENALPITPNTSVPSMDADPKDSPTLGPPAGLSGMVRQHLRSDSGASSVYGADPQVPAHNTERTSRAFDSKALDDLVSDLNPWATQDQEWTASFYGGNADASRQDLEPSPAKPQEQTPVANASSSRQSTTSSDAGKETDVFHSQLADGARRIRERLTSYVETDSARNSYDAPSTPESTSRPNPLAGLLRKQSSRGSLIEKPREVNNPSKTIKLLGLSNSTMSSSVSPNKPAFEKEDPPLSPMPEEPASPVRHSPEKSSSEQEKEDPAHAALRQFRQARRELQKLKETETRQRHQQAVAESPGGFNDNSPTDRGAAPRSQSRPGRNPGLALGRILAREVRRERAPALRRATSEKTSVIGVGPRRAMAVELTVDHHPGPGMVLMTSTSIRLSTGAGPRMGLDMGHSMDLLKGLHMPLSMRPHHLPVVANHP